VNVKDAINLVMSLSIVVIFRTQGQSLRDTTLRADYVIICSSTNQAQAERLANFRRSYNGFVVKIVSIESVYVNFYFSNAPDSSLRSFIGYATMFWRAPRPRFFVLAGNVNTIPSHKEPGLELPPTIHEDSVLVDTWFVEGEGSSSESPRSSASIGRLPAWTAGQLDTIISKTIAYDQDLSDPWNVGLRTSGFVGSDEGGFCVYR